MAETFLSRALAWLGPNRSAIGDDPTADAPDPSPLISRSGETFLVPGGYLGIATNTDPILARGASDLKLYDDLLDDDVAFSNFQQRRLGVIAREWEVSPGDENDPRSVAAADHLRANLKAIAFDRICDRMLFGVWYGYSVAEGMVELGADGLYRLADIVVPDRKHFGFTHEGELRLTASPIGLGEKLPANRFWVMRTGGSHDFAFYGLGLAHWCYWPIWFKRNVVKFWALYLEKLGYPTVVGEQQDAWTDGEKSGFLAALVAIGRDRAVKLPEGGLTGLKLMEAQRTASAGSGYGEFVTEQNEALMRVILGQPGTSKATAQGVGGKQAEVHEGVKEQLVKADADLLCESFNATFPVWLTRWNYGEDVAPPRVFRVLEKPEDVDSIAERDVKLDGIGIRRTDESIEAVYGPGYERADPPAIPPQLAPTALGQPPAIAGTAAANDDELDPEAREAERATFAAQDVAPLYIYRPLKSPAALLRWAREAGIPNLVPAADLHVTVLHSSTPVDWFALSDGWAYSSNLTVAEGGARKVERFGKEGAIVLRFASEELAWSHQSRRDRGASHDFREYLPHITLGFDPDGLVDLDAIAPFVGELEFGAERFERARPFLPPGFREVEFSAGDEDAIARLAETLADEANPLLLEFGSALQEALAGVGSPEAARVALLEAFERLPAERMARMLGLPLILERMAGEAGIEG